MNRYFYILCIVVSFYSNNAFSQDCSALSATCQPFESRCAATGKILVTAINGSGTYNYRVTGPVNTSYSSSNSITGLPAGTYNVTVKDVLWGCIINVPNIVVSGSYSDPRFDLVKTDITCLNATNGSVSIANPQFGRSPFLYTIIAPSPAGVGTSNSTGVFNYLPAGTFYIRMTDSCGGIQTRNVDILDYNWWISSTTGTKTTCTNASFHIQLKDNKGNLNDGTGSAAFTGFKYGVVRTPGDTTWSNSYDIALTIGSLRSVTLIAKDGCGNFKTKSWTDTKVPAVAANVSLSNYACTTFSATITGIQNLTSPQYCLYNNANVQVGCNSTGVFPNLTYGSYSIRIADVCYDTTFIRYFSAVAPKPSVSSSVTIANLNCSSFDVSITGQSNLFNPNYCLYTDMGLLIGCNATGVFTGVAIGSYCMKVTSPGCYDTTITRCFTTKLPVYSVAPSVSISNKACTDFTASVTGQTNFSAAQYCLYDNTNTLITCNNTGVFNNLLYGSYCITTNLTAGKGICYDTSMTRCFTVNKPVSSVSSSVSISNKTCTDFKATITWQTNLTNPTYCLYSGATQLECNKSGFFNNVPYGSYCIQIENGCGDTTIQRCFTVAPDPVIINATPQLSCTLNRTKMKVYISSGNAPFNIEIYDPSNILVSNINGISAGTYYLDNLPDLPAGQKYKVEVFDACNNVATDVEQPLATTLSKSIMITNNCPGGTAPQGSSTIDFNLSSNSGKFFPSVIKKDGSTVSINYSASNSSETLFTFNNLAPGTYIFRSVSASSCAITVYDTITVSPYKYPSLQNSSLYQCDNNGFSVGAVVNGGAAPFQYEIIGSVPSIPAITAPLQSSPVFNINNGTTYRLVRLRTIDGCGNASINDVSVLPLANMIVSTQNACMNNNITLHVDTIPNAVYTWYKRIWPNDSVLVGSSVNYNIPMLLAKDTGTYICKVLVNNGCMVRVSYFDLTGSCLGLLANEGTKLTGKKVNDKVQLEWLTLDEAGVKEYQVERKKENDRDFTSIASVAVTSTDITTNVKHLLIDADPGQGNILYRIKITSQSGKVTYSNQIAINNKAVNTISVYPNPATDMINIQLNNREQKEITVRLIEANGRVIVQKSIVCSANDIIKINRPANLTAGLYLLSIADTRTGDITSQQIIFR